MSKQAKSKDTKDTNSYDTASYDTAYDPLAFQNAIQEAYEKALPLLQDFWMNNAKDMAAKDMDPFNVRKAVMNYWQTYLSNPGEAIKMQSEYWQQWMDIWNASAQKYLNEAPQGTEVAAMFQPEKGDRRFSAPEWQESAVFDFIKQSYLLTCDWLEKSVREAQGLSEEDKQKLSFSVRQMTAALSPSNFVMTNPEVLKETVESGGKNLIKGFENLIEDLKRGAGDLKISMTDYEAFELGGNIATTRGDVIYQNELMQLIQYAPTTKEVFKRPLLIVPPWINKYYILDLREDNSLIKWAVDQGHTVFVISWVNPDKKLSQKRFEDYMREGVLEAMDQIKKTTGEESVNAIGYCLGGTLLSITLAFLKAQKQEDKITSATMLTTLTDFEHAGEMKLFMDEEQLNLMDRMMDESGVLEGKQLQKTFSLLRANDLIWSFVVNNYLMGKEPFPFDLLYWNDDSTNMPAAMHSFYLRKLYRDNLLTKPGGISMEGTPIDLKKIDTPIFMLSTREDHIAPWQATYALTQATSGPVKFTLAASGHIAGVVNAPARNKYCYWAADDTPPTPDEWLESTTEHQGSWWPSWQEWVSEFTGEKVKARKVTKTKSLEPAPGSYVRVRP